VGDGQFKPGDQVRCVDNRGAGWLIKNYEYTVGEMGTNPAFVYLPGITYGMDPERFELVTEDEEPATSYPAYGSDGRDLAGRSPETQLYGLICDVLTRRGDFAAHDRPAVVAVAHEVVAAGWVPRARIEKEPPKYDVILSSEVDIKNRHDVLDMWKGWITWDYPHSSWFRQFNAWVDENPDAPVPVRPKPPEPKKLTAEEVLAGSLPKGEWAWSREKAEGDEIAWAPQALADALRDAGLLCEETE
jgi:hypothetical protein